MKDLLDILLDKDNSDPIVLSSENGEQVTFEQIAVIPIGNEEELRLYVILKPMDDLSGVASDEAIVFLVDNDKGSSVLKVETDENVARHVFDNYYRLLDEVIGKSNTDDATRFVRQLSKKRKGGKK